jgi:hypothetical protein
VNCFCATNPHCQSSVAIYDLDRESIQLPVYTIVYIVPGWVMTCSLTDSLLLSTLECLYSNSTCFPILISYIKQRYFYNVENPSWFDVRPLLDDPLQSHFSPNTSIETIVQEMMIDQWNQSFSYDYFYEVCAPSYCTYSQVIHTKTVIGVIVTLISLIGGLIISLRLIIPRLVKFITGLLKKIFKKQEQRQQSEGKHYDRISTDSRSELFLFMQLLRDEKDNERFALLCLGHQNCLNRLKGAVRKMITFLHITLIDLNIFPRRDFGVNVDNSIAKRLGQWATRLFIILFVTTLTILSLYTIAQPRSLTQTYQQPSLDFYQQLVKNYGNQLKCACSSISSTYDRFVQIQPTFHQVSTDPRCKIDSHKIRMSYLSLVVKVSK